ncbi:MAG: MBL fold metallo-hydrolase [candidate division KSB1 bacterium]|nr:MBL fold metallo-hydrolase [candidate division KSB1 bacterium]
MKITLLGTGASEGVPAFRCQCKTCKEAREKGGRHVRQNAAALVEGRRGEKLLLDLPLSIKMMLNHQGISDDHLDAIFITHSDFDHIGGLFHLQQNTNQNGFQGKEEIPVYMPADVVELFEKSLDLTEFEYAGQVLKKQYMFRIRTMRPYETIRVGGLAIQSLESNHLRVDSREPRDCFGYLVTEGDRRLAYFPDAFVDMPQRTFDILAESRLDFLFIDCTFETSERFATCNHLDISQLIDISKRIRPDRIFATHISHRNFG